MKRFMFGLIALCLITSSVMADTVEVKSYKWVRQEVVTKYDVKRVPKVYYTPFRDLIFGRHIHIWTPAPAGAPMPAVK